MSEAVRFLHALAHALATINLYSPGHPASRRAIEGAWEALATLLLKDEHPIFLFLGGAPVYRERAIQEMRGWPWSSRLSHAGIQRLEFGQQLTPEGFSEAMDRIMLRMNEGAREGSAEEPAIAGIMFGAVVIEEQVIENEEPGERPVEGSREIQLDLPDELDAMAFLLGEAREGRVARAEAESIVRILGSLLDHHPLPQALAPADHLQYPAVHAINTALLTMASGSASGVDRPGRHRIGVAALLHDIGMTRLPPELALSERLSEEDRKLVETHTALGARLLMGIGAKGLELAATVAWEHHLRPDGTGYPARRFRPATHWASRLTGAVAAYVALRSERPFRAAWSPERATAYLETGAGKVFDIEAARLLAGLVRPT